MTQEMTEENGREGFPASTLPDRDPTRIWGAQGFGGQCSLCARPVTRDEVEYELEFGGLNDDLSDGLNDGHSGSYHVHVKCFVEWERKRRHARGKTLAGDSSGGLALRSESTASDQQMNILSGGMDRGTIARRERYNDKQGPV